MLELLVRCKKSSFAENYRCLIWKCKFNWNTNITYLMGNLNTNQQLVSPVSHDASVLHNLCTSNMHDDDICKTFTKT